jgi:drug/metabolite transporter (DMT)-like permease
MIIQGILSKIISEIILSTYPVFIKLVNISFLKKMLYRFATIIFISLFLIDTSYISKYLFHKDGLLLSFYTIIHVYFSYKGFEILKGGVANSILFTYPLIILYYSGSKNYWIYFFILIGLLLFCLDDIQDKKMDNIYEYSKGIFYMIGSAITEALIYFSVLKLDTKNNWNHMFISYFFGLLLLLTVYIYQKNINKEKEDKEENNEEDNKGNKEEFQLRNLNKTKNVNLFAFFFNLLTIVIGYYLRFYSMNRIDSKLYAILTYLGIIFTYISSYLINQEEINMYNISGSLIIIFSNLYLLYN